MGCKQQLWQLWMMEMATMYDDLTYQVGSEPNRQPDTHCICWVNRSFDAYDPKAGSVSTSLSSIFFLAKRNDLQVFSLAM